MVDGGGCPLPARLGASVTGAATRSAASARRLSTTIAATSRAPRPRPRLRRRALLGHRSALSDRRRLSERHPGALDHAIEAGVGIVIVTLAVATYLRPIWSPGWRARRGRPAARRLPPRPPSVARLLRGDAHGRGAVAPDHRHQRHPDRDRRQRHPGAAQRASGRGRPPGGDQPQAHRLRPGRGAAGGSPDRGDRPRVRRLSRATQDRMADVSGAAEETINAIRTVQSFAQEDRESTRFAAATEDAFAAAARARPGDAGRSSSRWCSVPSPCALAGRARRPDRPHHRRRAVRSYSTPPSSPAPSAASATFGDLQRAAGATERLFELLDAPPTSRPRQSLATTRRQPRRAFQGVSRLSLAPRPAGPWQPTRVRPGDRGPGRPFRCGQDQRFPAPDALLRSDPGPHPVRRDTDHRA